MRRGGDGIGFERYGFHQSIRERVSQKIQTVGHLGEQRRLKHVRGVLGAESHEARVRDVHGDELFRAFYADEFVITGVAERERDVASGGAVERDFVVWVE